MNEIIGLSDHIDLALIALYLFWIFFFGLVIYLNREGMREGFPAVSESTGRSLGGGLIGLPSKKSFKLDDGSVVTAPHAEVYDEALKALPVERWPGAPIEPTSDPMLAGVGPGAWTKRIDKPLRTHTGALKILPMRNLPDFQIVREDRDPRGLPVVGSDGAVGGVVTDVWIDREEQMIRYLEVAVGADNADAVTAENRHILLPMTMALVGGRFARLGVWRPEVKVSSILGAQFQNVPGTRDPDEVTLREEDRITAYYGAGTLYQTPSRRDPLI